EKYPDKMQDRSHVVYENETQHKPATTKFLFFSFIGISKLRLIKHNILRQPFNERMIKDMKYLMKMADISLWKTPFCLNYHVQHTMLEYVFQIFDDKVHELIQFCIDNATTNTCEEINLTDLYGMAMEFNNEIAWKVIYKETLIVSL